MSKPRPSLSRITAAAGTPPRPTLVAPAAATPEPEPPPALSRSASVKPSRQDKTMVAGYFSKDLGRAVKLLAVERGTSTQALIGEALDDLLRKHGKSPFGER